MRFMPSMHFSGSMEIHSDSNENEVPSYAYKYFSPEGRFKLKMYNPNFLVPSNKIRIPSHVFFEGIYDNGYGGTLEYRVMSPSSGEYPDIG
jgi:hypothetical protein